MSYMVFLGLSQQLSGKESACSVGVAGSIPGSGRSPGGGCGNTLQYSCLGKPMHRGDWRATVHGIAELDTTKRLNTHSLPNACVFHTWLSYNH